MNLRVLVNNLIV